MFDCISYADIIMVHLAVRNIANKKRSLERGGVGDVASCNKRNKVGGVMVLILEGG